MDNKTQTLHIQVLEDELITQKELLSSITKEITEDEEKAAYLKVKLIYIQKDIDLFMERLEKIWSYPEK